MSKTMLDATTPQATTPSTPAADGAKAAVPTPSLESTLTRIVADALEQPLRYIEQTLVAAEGE
jgi:hypothetical protein